MDFMSKRTSCVVILTTLQEFGNVEEFYMTSSAFMNPGEVWGFYSGLEMYYREGDAIVMPRKEFKKGLLDKVEFKVLDGGVGQGSLSL